MHNDAPRRRGSRATSHWAGPGQPITGDQVHPEKIPLCSHNLKFVKFLLLRPEHYRPLGSSVRSTESWIFLLLLALCFLLSPAEVWLARSTAPSAHFKPSQPSPSQGIGSTLFTGVPTSARGTEMWLPLDLFDLDPEDITRQELTSPTCSRRAHGMD